MSTISEMKNSALATLEGKWTPSCVLYFIVMLLTGSVSCIPHMGSLLSLLFLPLSYAIARAFLQQKRGGTTDIQDLCEGWNTRIYGTLLLKCIYVFLWSLLLIVPGIIKSISYSMTEFILADNPELKYNEAIERSMDMMRGHKMRYFLLQLSFIGWMLLALLTLGLGFVMLSPYMMQTNTFFYEELKAEYENRQA